MVAFPKIFYPESSGPSTAQRFSLIAGSIRHAGSHASQSLHGLAGPLRSKSLLFLRATGSHVTTGSTSPNDEAVSFEPNEEVVSFELDEEVISFEPKESIFAAQKDSPAASAVLTTFSEPASIAPLVLTLTQGSCAHGWANVSGHSCSAFAAHLAHAIVAIAGLAPSFHAVFDPGGANDGVSRLVQLAIDRGQLATHRFFGAGHVAGSSSP